MRSIPVLPGRRAFLRNLFLGPVAARAPAPLVVVFLRGAMDGLNTVVPWRDDDYRRLRPTLALPGPDPRAPAGRAVLDLDGRFGLHPALEPLLPLWREGRMAIVHAVGSDDRTRSHFEAQDQVEHGSAAGQVLSGGWIGRHLRADRGGAGSPAALRALAFGETIPESLRGAPAAGAIRSLEEIRLVSPSGDEAGLEAALGALHAGGTDLVSVSGRDTLSLLRRVQGIRAAAPPPGAPPADDFGRALSEVARLLLAGVGLEAACIDLGGFDTHFGQGGLDHGLAGGLAGPLASLGAGLAGFAKALGPRFEETTVVVMTEFGRRAYENTALGTDHGTASAMFLLGGGLRGGKVHGRWPGLAKEALYEESDLAVTTDYRTVLAEVLAKRCGAADLDAVFPGFVPEPIGVCG